MAKPFAQSNAAQYYKRAAEQIAGRDSLVLVPALSG